MIYGNLTKEEYELASAVRHLLEDTHRYGRGNCSPRNWKILNADEDLAWFFKACNIIGDNAWLEENFRIRKESARRDKEAGYPIGGISNRVILEQVEAWKVWGKAYREAMAINGSP